MKDYGGDTPPSADDAPHYSPGFLGHKYGISTAQAQELIERYGDNPAELDAAAERLKSSSDI